jgi:hypothetical protein
MLGGRGGGAEVEDRSGRGADFGSSGPMERGQNFGGKSGSKFKDEIDDEIPF